MTSLQGTTICPTVRAKQNSSYICPVDGLSIKADILRSRFWGFKGIKDVNANIRYFPNVRLRTKVYCSYSSSSNDNNSTAENFNENDEDYVNSSVVEAVEVKSGPDGFTIKMRDGEDLKCDHNSPQAVHQPNYAPRPAIVLKMEDGTGLLLPIIVLEMPSMLLMSALRNVQTARPTMYQVFHEMIDKMGYSVKLVRVTKRVHGAYFAQLYLTKLGNETENVSFDLRPSDAINIAVRCKVPIQVNKYLAYNDGLKVVESVKLSLTSGSTADDGILFTELDRPSEQPCMDTKEFDIAQKMWTAVGEERYKDAAQWRDKLDQLRSKRNST